MKKFFLLIMIIALANCNSIKNHNAHLNDLIAVEKLQADVDVTHQKMKDLHPKLYWYISEKDLSFKFDSLKKTITSPLTSFEFYKKLAPVVSAVREGHMILMPQVRKYSKKENKSTIKKGVGPFSQFEFEMFNDKMYVVKNKFKNSKVAVGSEVISINDKKTTAYLQEYNQLFASDGYNTTFKTNRLPRSFARFYAQEFGTIDSLKYSFKLNDSIQNIVISRKPADTTGQGKKKKIVLTDLEKAALKAKNKAIEKQKSIAGYNNDLKEINRTLKFIEKDSAVAILKIRGFSGGKQRKFYKQVFQKIKDYKSATLVIDLRNNGGGSLAEIENLYSYLSEKEFHFVDDGLVTRKSSLWHMDYLKGSWYWWPFKLVAAPITYSILYLMPKKKADGNYYITNSKKPIELEENAFKGKVYVMINGGSFSASSIISSNLQGSKRATFVGSETGGAFNGTIAGIMPLEKIPNSKLKLRVGLIACIPFYKTEVDGRGIFPDKEITPTIQDRINAVDPEMKWILDDIKK